MEPDGTQSFVHQSVDLFSCLDSALGDVDERRGHAVGVVDAQLGVQRQSKQASGDVVGRWLSDAWSAIWS